MTESRAQLKSRMAPGAVAQQVWSRLGPQQCRAAISQVWETTVFEPEHLAGEGRGLGVE